MRRRLPLGLLVSIVVAVAACGGGDTAAPPAGDGGSELEGTFAIAPGECADGGVTSGSWFRMVQSGGTVDDGPFVANSDSPCGDTTWTPLSPGTDGGLTTSAYQPHPEPAFDADGNGMASAITEPTIFFGVAFAIATNETDPQTQETTTAPTVTNEGGQLSGDMSAWAAAWNGQHFNQGAPKPDGTESDQTRSPAGTYDDGTGTYMIEWTSQIVGGPFNGFTGVWHLEGNFTEN